MKSILPIGLQIRRALRAKSNAFSTEDNEWLAKTIALIPAAAANAAVDSALPALPTAAAAAKFSGITVSSIVVPVAAIATTAAIAVGSVAFLNTYSESVQMPNEHVAMYEETQYLQGDVMFAGGFALQENINPVTASGWATNEYGDMTAGEWWITRENDDEILIYGEGSEVDNIYSKTLETGGPGYYVLNFLMEDTIGGTYMVSRQFEIRDIDNDLSSAAVQEKIDSTLAGEEHAAQNVIND